MFKLNRALMTMVMAVGLLAVDGMPSAQAQARAAAREATREGIRESARDDEGSSGGSSGWRAPGHLLDGSAQIRPHQIAVMWGIPWSFGGTFPLSLGARYHLPLVHNGFIPKLNEWFGLELGADVDLYFWSGSTLCRLIVPVEAFWAFRFNPSLAVYTRLGVGFEFWFGSGAWRWGTHRSGFRFTARVISQWGVMWNFSEKLNLRAETGYPYFLRIGIGFNIT
jgi:hypothetical protein